MVHEFRWLHIAFEAVDFFALATNHDQRGVGIDLKLARDLRRMISVNLDPPEFSTHRHDRGIGKGLLLEDLAPVSSVESKVQDHRSVIRLRHGERRIE